MQNKQLWEVPVTNPTCEQPGKAEALGLSRCYCGDCMSTERVQAMLTEEFTCIGCGTVGRRNKTPPSVVNFGWCTNCLDPLDAAVPSE